MNNRLGTLGRMLVSTISGSVIIVSCISLTNLLPQTVKASDTSSAIVPYSAADIPNPLRGQYDNLTAGLFPQLNSAQSRYPSWPNTSDASVRLEWKTLQPTDPRSLSVNASDDERYDFSELDQLIAKNYQKGQRTGFRVSTFNSCCSQVFPENTNSSVPNWLREVVGATNEYEYKGVTQVIPDWNNQAYLDYIQQLISALGRHYNKDERVSIYEFSGYGDFSENHNAFMRDSLKMPSAPPEESEQVLGYYSQYQDQYITKPSIDKLVDTTLVAFKDTQIVAAPGNPEIIKRLYRDSTKITDIKKPVGNRSDCLGEYSSYPTWAENQYSEYVKKSDPIIPILKARTALAPTITEWCNFTTNSQSEYYKKALNDVVRQRVSMLSSTGFPAQLSETVMPSEEYSTWSLANKYAGYRYAVSEVAGLSNNPKNGNLAATVVWKNFGNAPTYDQWKVGYDLVDEKGVVVRTMDSAIDLKRLISDQTGFSSLEAPKVATTKDSISIKTSGLPPGAYTLKTRVTWDEHKKSATHTVDYVPMRLALNARGEDGTYTVGTMSIGGSKERDDNWIGVIIVASTAVALLFGAFYYRHKKHSTK